MNEFAGRYRLFAFTLVVLAAVAAALVILKPFYPALLWATVLAVLIKPLHKRLSRRWSPNWSALWATLLTLAFIGVPVLVVGLAVYVKASATVQEITFSSPHSSESTIDTMLVRVDDLIRPVAERMGMGGYSSKDWVAANRDTIVQGLRGPVSAAAVSTVSTVLTLIFAFLTLFFILRDGHRLRAPVLDLIPLPHEKSESILAKLGDTIRAVFVGVVLVAIIQGAIAGVTYAIVGVPSALMWCLATMVMCMIPLLGAPFIYIPLALMLFANGKTWQGLVLLGVGFFIVSQIDNLLKPIFIGARTDLHPMAIFFSLLGGILVLGPIGLMAGPMLLTVLLALSEILREMIREGTTSVVEGTEPKPAQAIGD